MPEFVEVGRLEEFRPGRPRVVELDGKRVVIFNRAGRLHALQDACPHMGASLADGKIEGNQIVCHWHGWKFDLDTGQGDRRSWACARVYEIKVEGETVYLGRFEPPLPQDAAEEEDWVRWDPDKHLKPPGERKD